MLKHLIPVINSIKHHVYVEVFGGGGSVLYAKQVSHVEVYNDLDQGLYDFMTVMSDPELFKKFKRRVEPLLVSRQLYNECRDGWSTEKNQVKRVAQWFVMIRQGFSGIVNSSWGFSVSDTDRSITQTCQRWMSCIKLLPTCHKRLQRVQIENQDWSKIFVSYDSSDTLFYLDPPYVHGTRRGGGGEYTHEMTDDDHKRLVEEMLKLKGSIVLSGYQNPLYLPLETAGWIRKDFGVSCFATGRTRCSSNKGKGNVNRDKSNRRVECLWIKPHTTGEGLFKVKR